MGAKTSSRRAATRTGAASCAGSLGASLTIVEAREGQRTLTQLLAQGRAEIHANGLKSVDTAGLQLLLVAGRAARARGLALTVRGAQTLLLEAARNLGLEDALTEAVELIP